MTKINKFKDITDEELEELIEQNASRSERKLRYKDLATKVQKPKSNFSIFLIYVLQFLKFMFTPYLIFSFIKEVILYKKYTKLIKDVINSNKEFFEFIELFKFYPAWFTRLFSIQPIPENFIGVSDEELYEVTIKALLPIRSMVERSGLLSVLVIRIERKLADEYTIILEPENFEILKTILKSILFSVLVWIILILGIIIVYK